MHFVIFFLLTMPALSISGILGLPYFPNEKLSFLLILFLFLNNKYKIDMVHALLMFFIACVIAILVILHGIIDTINIPEVNTIYFFIALIFYVAYFKKFGNILLMLIPTIVLMQLSVSLFQQLSMFSGNNDLAMIFNNYSFQSNYIYPHSYGGFYRTSGLFNESSQYATFLVLYIVLYFQGFIQKRSYTKFILYFTMIDFIINESITAYIILFLYLLYKIFFFRKKIYLKISIIFSFISMPFLFSDIFSGVIYKIVGTFSMTGSFGRLRSAIDKIELVSEHSPFIGLGLNWKVVSHDIISVYYYGFGLIGLVCILLFIVYVTFRTRNIVIFIFLLFIMTNATLLVSTNIILISFAFYIGSVYQNRKLNYLEVNKVD